MKYPRLEPEALRAEIARLDGWAIREDGLALVKTFRFPSFVEAFSFMTQSAFVAEKLNHHPEWSNVYSRVDVALTTHDSQGVTERDVLLATAMQKAAARHGA